MTSLGWGGGGGGGLNLPLRAPFMVPTSLSFLLQNKFISLYPTFVTIVSTVKIFVSNVVAFVTFK